ncbi:MAG: Ig-like domain-containing protein [Candidatus Eremiobacteraeota bacterium]|nr:Ig-like domain-containing protein [Candidatus Eremiobacteraeota bacterium]
MQGFSVSGAAISSLSIVPAAPTLPLGTSMQLKVNGTFTDGSIHDVTQQVAWNVNAPAVASISGGGLATGLQVGSTGIVASLNNIDTSDTITVQPLFTVAYFDAVSGVDSTIRITNPATTEQSLCAMVYVFDQDQQMSECCGCLISDNGLLTLSLNKDLLSNPLTGVQSKSGTMMLVSASEPASGLCNASTITPAGAVLAWSTHLPQSGTTSSSEVPFSSAPLTSTLSAALQAQCAFIQQLGSGQGLCSCGGSKPNTSVSALKNR